MVDPVIVPSASRPHAVDKQRGIKTAQVRAMWQLVQECVRQPGESLASKAIRFSGAAQAFQMRRSAVQVSAAPWLTLLGMPTLRARGRYGRRSTTGVGRWLCATTGTHHAGCTGTTSLRGPDPGWPPTSVPSTSVVTLLG